MATYRSPEPPRRPTMDDSLAAIGKIAQPRPGDLSEERLLHAVETHTELEAESLAAYRHLADTSPDPVVRILLRLILEDEVRHHGLLQRIVASLGDSLDWTQSGEALPADLPPRNAETVRTMEAIRLCIRHERESHREQRRFARQVSKLHGGLFALLLEYMALDSKKHEEVLRFVLRRLQSRV